MICIVNRQNFCGQNFLLKFLGMAVLLIMISEFSVSRAFAAEPVPGDACTIAGAFMQSGGPETSGVVYSMTCKGGVWVKITESDASGNLDIGKVKAPLHVGGAVVIGTSSLSCASSTKGAVRYNATNNNLELCNGSSWGAVSVGACGDADPDAFNFTDLVNQSTSTLVTSNIL